jgi:hypothetical protein
MLVSIRSVGAVEFHAILSVITICDFCLASIPYKARVASIRMSRATVEVTTTPIGVESCEGTYMKSTSESLSHPETSNGKAAGGNCVVARRGGEQPEADLRSQTKVN